MVRGTAQVTVNELVKTVHENESIYIPIGAVHRLENPGKIQLELIEVQTGSYFGEDDIIRIEDDYRRTWAVAKLVRRSLATCRRCDAAHGTDDVQRSEEFSAASKIETISSCQLSLGPAFPVVPLST